MKELLNVVPKREVGIGQQTATVSLINDEDLLMETVEKFIPFNFALTAEEGE